jgi:hypothetical protein
MKRFPVAGNVIKIEFFMGYSGKEVLQAFGPAFFVAAFVRQLPFLPFNSAQLAILSIVLSMGGFLLLYLKNEAQTPIQYLRSVLLYYLTTNEYYHRRNRDTDLGKTQDVPISQLGPDNGLKGDDDE